MTASTPDELKSYLKYLFAQHPMVKHVITGEPSRVEEATIGDAAYPQVQVETPVAWLPKSEMQKSMSTTIYVVNRSNGNDADDDSASDVAYRICEDLIAMITAHHYSSDIPLSLKNEGLEITPIIDRTSDLTRGRKFDVEYETDKLLCKDRGMSPDVFVMPQFSWGDDAKELRRLVLTITDQSIINPDCGLTWWWQESHVQLLPVEFDPEVDTLDTGAANDVIYITR